MIHSPFRAINLWHHKKKKTMSSFLYPKMQKYDDIAENKYSCGFARSPHPAAKRPALSNREGIR